MTASSAVAYNREMTFSRALHLLVVIALLFSQMATARHMIAHVSEGPLQSTLSSATQAHSQVHQAAGSASLHDHDNFSPASSPADPSRDGKAGLELSCGIYHAFASSFCVVGAVVHASAVPDTVLPDVQLQTSEVSSLAASRYFIRGPPVFS